MSFSVSEPFKATKIWNELVEHLKTSLQPRKRRWKLQTFDNCFRGSDVVEQLQNYVFNHPELATDPNKVQVKSLAQKLLESQVIESVASTSEPKKEIFDQGSKLYRFNDNYKSSEDLTRHSIATKQDKKKKRLSFDRLNIHRRSSKRKSMRIHSKEDLNDSELSQVSGKECGVSDDNNNDIIRRKRRASFSGPLKALEHLSETPKKLKRRSIMHVRTQKTTLHTQTEDDISPSFCQDIWFEVTLTHLLKLLDVEFLDDILSPEKAHDKKAEFTEITNSPYSRLLNSYNQSRMDIADDQESGRRGRDTIWKNAAVACFDALREYPLSHNKDFEFHNKIAITEAGISNSLAKFYSSLTDSLIPEKFSALVEGILHLLSSRKRDVPQALRLLFLLLPHERREHLKRLLNFFDKSLASQTRISKEQRRRYLCRVFVEGIVPMTTLEDEKENTESLLSIMIDENKQLFQIPSTIKSEVKRHINCLQRSDDHPVLSTLTCKRVSLMEYESQKDDHTKQSLLELLNAIVDDLTLSLKEKECRLRDFQQHHLDIFCLQFPNGEF